MLLFESPHYADHGGPQSGERCVEIFARWRKLRSVVQQRCSDKRRRGVGDVPTEFECNSNGMAQGGRAVDDVSGIPGAGDL